MRSEPSINDYAMAWLRISIGLVFILLAQGKIWGTDFLEHGLKNSILQFLQSGAYPFMVPFLRDFVLPHTPIVAYFIAYGELCIGLGLVFGFMVRGASFFGLVYMGILFVSTNYPGPHAQIWDYFNSGIQQVVMALCFVAFSIGDSTRVWSLTGHGRRRLRQLAQQTVDSPDSHFASSNVFGK